METVIALVVGFFLMEAYAWLPKVSQWLIDRAVARVCAEAQERCRHEWNERLDGLPNTFFRLVHAISFIHASAEINAVFFEAKRSEVDCLLGALSSQQSARVEHIRVLKTQLNARPAQRLEIAVTHGVFSLNAMRAPDGIPRDSFQNFVGAFEAFGNNLVKAIDLSSTLMRARLDGVETNLARVSSLLETAEKKYAAFSLSPVAKSYFGEAELFLSAFVAELDDLKSAIERVNLDEGNDDVIRRHRNVQAAIQGVIEQQILR